MAGLTSTIDDVLTVFDGWHFTCLFREIKRITINTGLTIPYIILTLRTVGIVTLNTSMGAVLILHKEPRLALRAIICFNTDITVLHIALSLVDSFLTSQINLWPNTTVIVLVSWNVSEPAKTPACAPWVLDDPLSFCVTNQKHSMVSVEVVGITG